MPDTLPLYGERAGTVLKEAKYKYIQNIKNICHENLKHKIKPKSKNFNV